MNSGLQKPFLPGLAIFILLSGCAIIPKPITDNEFEAQARLDRERVTANQEPVTGPISQYEAIARTLKYNLDFHLELARKALASSELDVSRFEMLPQLVSSLSYSGRDNYSGAASQSLVTGVQSLIPSTSSDRDVRAANLSLTWNVLDFGISYFRAKQAADNVLVNEEGKRKVVNRMVQDTRAAYWRAVSNERLSNKMELFLKKVDQAITDSKRVEVEKLDRPLTALTYQRELISIKRELEELHRNLALSKIQLAALMNLPLGEPYTVEIPERSIDIKTIGLSPQLMEQLALENRPEIRELGYKQRINRQETKTAFLRLFPGLNLDFGKDYNSNSFLFNNDWLGYGARISWDLMNLLKLPSKNREIKAREKLLDAQRLTLSMAVMTQVYVSLAQYEFAKREYETARDYYNTQDKILEQVVSAVMTETTSQQSLIREEMNMLIAEVKFDIAYSELENSYAGIFAALGLDPFSGDGFMLPLGTLAERLKEKFDSLSVYDQIFRMKIE